MPLWLTDFLTRTGDTLLETLLALIYPAAFFLVLAFLVKGKRAAQDISRAVPETGLNAQLILFNLIFVTPLLALLVILLTDMAKSMGFVSIGTEFWAQLPFGLTLFAAVFIGDFVGYWRHRFEHCRLLWPSHAIHHSDTQMTWFTLERFHPINRVTTVVIDSGALLLLGFPEEAILANNLVRHYYGYLIHADLPWRYGPLAYLFVSPVMHRWHHAADVEAYNTNYATVFSVFDRAFGTYRVPGPCDVALGVDDNMGSGLFGQLSYPFRGRSYKRLFANPTSSHSGH